MLFTFCRKLILGIGVSSLLLGNAWAAVEVLEHFPACDYQVLDEVTKKRKIKLVNHKLTLEYKQNATLEAIGKIISSAEKIDADGVIILNSRIIQPSEATVSRLGEFEFQLAMTAELIKQCEPEAGRKAIPTGYSATGVKQAEFSYGNINTSWAREISLSAPSNNNFLRPEIAYLNATLSQGIANVQLGDSLDKSKAILGTPSFEVALEAHSILAYGRSLFLLFEGDSLSFISNEGHWFTSEFISLLEFDERIDDRSISVEGIKIGQEIGEIDSASSSFDFESGQLSITSASAELNLKIEQYHGKHSTDAKRVLTGYTLSKKGFNPNIKINFADSAQIYARLEDWLTSRNEDEKLTLNGLDVIPVGMSMGKGNTTRMLMTNHLLIEKELENVAKVTLLDGAFKQSMVENDVQWSLGPLSAGMNWDQAINVLPDDIFDFRDTIEVTTDSDLRNLYFYEDGNELTLFSAEVSIY